MTRCKEKLAEARSQRTTNVKASHEALRQTMEIAVEATADNQRLESQMVAKLGKCEKAWQEHEDTKMAENEAVNIAMGDWKRAVKGLEEAVAEGRQARLPGL